MVSMINFTKDGQKYFLNEKRWKKKDDKYVKECCKVIKIGTRKNVK